MEWLLEVNEKNEPQMVIVADSRWEYDRIINQIDSTHDSDGDWNIKRFRNDRAYRVVLPLQKWENK